MKTLAINGSPRRNGNTAILLNKTLEGAASAGSETEFIHLNDNLYHGCVSCFGCKKIGGKSYGKCALNDNLTPILKKVEEADAIVFGSPIYFGRETGHMLSFFERLFFQYFVYDGKYTCLLDKKIPTGYIYTMNVNEEQFKEFGYSGRVQYNENLLTRVFGQSESLLSYDTYQFDDYSKYVSTAFSQEHKAKVRAEQFPIDCQKAFEMGVRLAGK